MSSRRRPLRRTTVEKGCVSITLESPSTADGADRTADLLRVLYEVDSTVAQSIAASLFNRTDSDSESATDFLSVDADVP